MKKMTCYHHHNVEIDEDGRCPVCESAIADMTVCICGWDGQGTGPDGQFVPGDRCPVCGEYLR
jgi:RNA polymerase subunit RPABC4/transcription elongation factor Spt4